MSEHEKKDKSNLASWKFRLEDTINGDPDAPKAGLKVIRVYLNSLTDENPHPYAAMSVLMAKTGLSEATIRRTRKGLIDLGYMVKEGVSSDGKTAGATRYALRNPREKYVDNLVREKLKTFRDEAREQARIARAGSEPGDDVPLKNDPHTADVTEAMSPQKMNPMSPSKMKGMSPSKMNPNTVLSPGNNTVGAAQAAPLEGSDSNSNRGEREDTFTGGDPLSADEAHSVFAEAFEALCKNSDDPSVAGHDYQSAHDEAEHQSFADEDQNAADDDMDIPYDNPCGDECGSDLNDASSDSQAEPITAVAEDRATFVTQKHHRWPDEYDLDAEYDEGGEPIRRDDADEADYDFQNDTDEEAYDGARQ